MARRQLIGLGQPTGDQEFSNAPAGREPIYGEVVLDATDRNSAGDGSAAAGQDGGGQELAETSYSERLRAQAYRCGEVTMKHLVRSEYLGESEAQSILQSFNYYINDLPDRSSILDILAFLVWIKLESKDEKAIREIRNLTRVMTSALNGKISHCGFTHLTEMPIELYQGHARVFEICSTLMCPIIQSHEKDFITVASINPITAAASGLLISKQMEKDNGIRPFVFVTTTSSNAWTWLCEKHFGS
ncbi:MAG: hypothetical protein KDN20_09425 [Verrucomicrobiae bacterium]|nr:hypothetical protein [Verrucomicrobiae bacterium]